MDWKENKISLLLRYIKTQLQIIKGNAIGPPPCRPDLPLAGVRLACAHHRQGFPCCHVLHLASMPAPLPRRERSGACVACFPNRHRPSPNFRRVGSHIAFIEACSAFTHVPACLLAEPPKAALRHQGASVYIVTSVNRPGCYQPKRQLLGGDSHPQGKRAFPRRTEVQVRAHILLCMLA